MEDFVPYELAKKLNKKGFDYPCIGHYVNNQLYIAHYQNAFHSDNDESIDAPTIYQVLKWLRDKKGLVIVVRLYKTNGWYWFIQDDKGELKTSHLASCDNCFLSYELTVLSGIEYVIDNNFI